LHEWLSGTIQDWNLDGINIHINVVNAAGIDCCEEMFSCGKKYALLHQASRIAHPGDVMALRFNREIVQVGAAKNDACVRWSRKQADLSAHASVETDSFSVGFTGYCGLEHIPHVRIACC